jgi:hypothetical protein
LARVAALSLLLALALLAPVLLAGVAAARGLAIGTRRGLVCRRRVILPLSCVASGRWLAILRLGWRSRPVLTRRRLAYSVRLLDRLTGAIWALAGSILTSWRLAGSVLALLWLAAERLIWCAVWIRRTIGRHLSLTVALLRRRLAVCARVLRWRLAVGRLRLRWIGREALACLAIWRLLALELAALAGLGSGLCGGAVLRCRICVGRLVRCWRFLAIVCSGVARRRVSKVGLLRRLAVREKASNEATKATSLLLGTHVAAGGCLRFVSTEHAGGQLPDEIVVVRRLSATGSLGQHVQGHGA